MNTNLSGAEIVAMAVLAAAANPETSPDKLLTWELLCARLQKNKIASAERIKATRKKRR
jgi:hypothetical protein